MYIERLGGVFVKYEHRHSYSNIFARPRSNTNPRRRNVAHHVASGQIPPDEMSPLLRKTTSTAAYLYWQSRQFIFHFFSCSEKLGSAYVAVPAKISARRALVMSAVLPAKPAVNRPNRTSLTGTMLTRYRAKIGPIKNSAAMTIVAIFTVLVILLSSKLRQEG